MSCINCEDCRTYDQKVPVCLSTAIQLGTMPGNALAPMIIRFEKPNGGQYEETVTLDSFAQIVWTPPTATVGIDFFSKDAGTYKVTILTTFERRQQAFEDTAGTPADCALLSFVDPVTDWSSGVMRLVFEA